jgi:hypothetical protein
MQCDQFGNMHPPSAKARSYYHEHVKPGHAVVVLHCGDTGEAKAVLMNTLVPYTPSSLLDAL